MANGLYDRYSAPDENSTVMAYDFCGRTLTRSGQDLGQDW